MKYLVLVGSVTLVVVAIKYSSNRLEPSCAVTSTEFVGRFLETVLILYLFTTLPFSERT